MYEFVIVGAGPAGLAFSQICAKFKKKVLLLDREDSIGGCHRVRRVNGMFTEHGPRIYSNSYKNFMELLGDMNLDFYELFTPYNFQMSTIGTKTIWEVITFSELLAFTTAFTQLVIDSSFGENISMDDFMYKNNFTEASKELVDRLCRLTDGAGSDRYTLNEFLSLFDQQFFYNIYQPKLPLDKGLFKIWQENLEQSGYVDIVLQSKVARLDVDKDRITGVHVLTPNGIKVYNGVNYILAIPPSNLLDIIKTSNLPYTPDFEIWTNGVHYNDYISLTFHYNRKLELPHIYGFPKSDWGLAYIVLSDYMYFEEADSQTVISITFCYSDRKSRYSGKTANQCTESELMDDALMQLRESYPDIPPPTLSLLSNGVVRDRKKEAWVSIDTAYMKTHRHGFIPFEINGVSNLYTVGAHTGNHTYNFTSLEAAVSNSLALAHKIIPGSRGVYHINSSWKVSDVIRILSVVIILLIVFRFRLQ